MGHERRPGAAASRQHRVDGVPEPRVGAEPLDARGPAGRRGLRDRGCVERRGERAHARDAPHGPDRRPRSRDATVSAPAVGRDAAARRDRDGARLAAGAADPGRAHHRARRDGRGRGARSDRRAAGPLRDERAVHQPQPGGDLEDVRSRRRAVRRSSGRGGPGAGRLRRPAPPLHRGAAPLDPARRGSQGPGPALDHPRIPPTARCRDRRVRLRRPLRARRRAVPPGGAGADPARRRACQPLSLPRPGADAAAVVRTGGDVRGRGPGTRSDALRALPHGHLEDVPSGGPSGRGAARRLHRRAPGRDARPGRRVRQRQDDARSDPARLDGPRRGIEPAARRSRARPARHATFVGAGARRADRVPEPRHRVEPSVLGPPHHRARRHEAPAHERLGT